MLPLFMRPLHVETLPFYSRLGSQPCRPKPFSVRRGATSLLVQLLHVRLAVPLPIVMHCLMQRRVS